MPADALQRFEAAAGVLLYELGYARGVPQPDAESLDRTSRIAAVFSEDAPASGRPLRATASGGPVVVDRNPCLFVIGCPRSGTTLLQMGEAR